MRQAATADTAMYETVEKYERGDPWKKGRGGEEVEETTGGLYWESTYEESDWGYGYGNGPSAVKSENYCGRYQYQEKTYVNYGKGKYSENVYLHMQIRERNKYTEVIDEENEWKGGDRREDGTQSTPSGVNQGGRI